MECYFLVAKGLFMNVRANVPHRQAYISHRFDLMRMREAVEGENSETVIKFQGPMSSEDVLRALMDVKLDEKVQHNGN